MKRQQASKPEYTPKKSTGDWRPAFLATLRKTANVRASCLAAGIERKTAYLSREKSAEFHEQWDDALAEAIDILEEAARKRALAISDTLLIFLLKSHRPEVYRERIDLRLSLIEHARKRAGELGLEERDAIAEAEAILKALPR